MVAGPKGFDRSHVVTGPMFAPKGVPIPGVAVSNGAAGTSWGATFVSAGGGALSTGGGALSTGGGAASRGKAAGVPHPTDTSETSMVIADLKLRLAIGAA
jgi:hypothetical protein